MTWSWKSIGRVTWRVVKWAVMVYALIIVAAAVIGLRDGGSGEIGERIGPDEEQYTAQIIANGVAMVNHVQEQLRIHDNDETYRRDAHAKAHGCLKANFEVLELESRYRHGLFAKPGAYKAWVRYSSGNERAQSDTIWDARGMAVKVMGVPGEKLLEPEKDATTQDFILMNASVFFLRSLREYVVFTRYQGQGDPVGYFREGGWNPFTWHWRFIVRALPVLKPPPDSLLDTRFNSLTAYKLGAGNNIKFRAQPAPCESGRPLSVEGVSWLCQAWVFGAPRFLGCDDDLLRNTMAQEIAGAPACFDFMVQLQARGKNMPVEDATVEWSEDESPFVPVARIEIPPQEFDTAEQNNYCESLAFNPWHSLPAHRPLGAMNRVRKAVYVEISRYRRTKNTANDRPETMHFPAGMQFPESFAEPAGWCLDGEDRDECAPSPPPPASEPTS